MSVLASGTLEEHVCPVCGMKTTQLRRGRCLSCYSKWVETQPVPVGAQCRICGERRRDNLQRIELLGRWHNFCHICAFRAQRLNPMPRHIEAVRAILARDRRFGDRRDGNGEDVREVRRERRVGERRTVLLSESDLLYEEDVFLDYDDPVDGESTGVYNRISMEELTSDSSSAGDMRLEL